MVKQGFYILPEQADKKKRVIVNFLPGGGGGGGDLESPFEKYREIKPKGDYAPKLYPWYCVLFHYMYITITIWISQVTKSY